MEENEENDVLTESELEEWFEKWHAFNERYGYIDGNSLMWKKIEEHDVLDYSHVLDMLKKAAEQDYESAQIHLGYIYSNKLGVDNENDALKWCQMAAEKGNAEAQFNLGLMYDMGRGMSCPDNDLAIKWYTKSAKQNYAGAQLNLGAKYLDMENYALGMEFNKLAAENNIIHAYFNIGLIYEIGLGVTPNRTRARCWYEMATKNGNVNAQVNLGIMYAEGRGVPRKFDKAIELFRDAEMNGDDEASGLIEAVNYAMKRNQ